MEKTAHYIALTIEFSNYILYNPKIIYCAKKLRLS
jgi:hypothetical protein